jgi:hypothetical protein
MVAYAGVLVLLEATYASLVFSGPKVALAAVVVSLVLALKG